MSVIPNPSRGLPTSKTFRKAVELYLCLAYPSDPPERVKQLLPPEPLHLAEWLMSESVERTPPDATLEGVRSFALRMGNTMYQHMKLRLSRPPNQQEYLFTVDCHDTFLHAPAGTPDHVALNEIKRHNATVAAAICTVMDEAGIPTERTYLRGKLNEARRQQRRRSAGGASGSGQGLT